MIKHFERGSEALPIADAAPDFDARLCF